MASNVTSAFEQKLAEYKQMVILRQEECTQLADVIEQKERELSSKASTLKTILIILGAFVALKSSLDLLMLNLSVSPLVMTILSVIFFVIGAAVSIIAALAGAYRYEEKAGGLSSLANLCKSYDRRFMSDYKKFIDRGNPDVTIARLESLIDLQNESLDNIRDRCNPLGVAVSKVQTSYRIDG